MCSYRALAVRHIPPVHAHVVHVDGALTARRTTLTPHRLSPPARGERLSGDRSGRRRRRRGDAPRGEVDLPLRTFSRPEDGSMQL
jgi:hypothetical protein